MNSWSSLSTSFFVTSMSSSSASRSNSSSWTRYFTARTCSLRYSGVPTLGNSCFCASAVFFACSMSLSSSARGISVPSTTATASGGTSWLPPQAVAASTTAEPSSAKVMRRSVI
jgi:hypothetical protein